MTWQQSRHWVFDMDGTLTVAVHDFEAIKRALDIPLAEDILGYLAALPEAQAAAKHAWLLEHERELAEAAQAAPGAVALVRELQAREYRLGILTRNAHSLALLTLQAIGLDDCFAIADVIGRDEATPKPDPGGLLHLAEQWQVAPESMVMVGDYLFDLECAHAAGAHGVLVNLPENPWPAICSGYAKDCAALLRQLS